MVKQARDQLESNETQEEIKEVFEGSCDLIPLKAVSKECRKLADEFIPDLVETLASEMNPQVVCSVAGLCNNEHVDELLEQAGLPTKSVAPRQVTRNTCDNCHKVMDIMEDKFEKMSRDEVLEKLLQVII